MSRSHLGRGRFLALSAAALAAAGCNSSNTNGTPGVIVTPSPPPNAPALLEGPFQPDLRFGAVPLPQTNSAIGYDPTGDARALILPGTPSPATSAIPGTQTTGSFGPTNRFVIRIPQGWNGKLVVAGTPSFRSEFASDAIWSDYVLSRGYAYASSNKGIPYNTVLEPAANSAQNAYPIPFDVAGLESNKFVFRFGALTPQPIPINIWNDDYAQLTRIAQYYITRWRGIAPKKTYAVGLSNGGAQVRSLLEQHPELVDGGVDWSGVYWSPSLNILTYLGPFINAMNTYVASGFTDQNAAAAILADGYPADRLQPGNTAHPSLWADYYSNVVPFYADLTLFAYAALIDPQAQTGYGQPVCTPNPPNPTQLPGNCNAVGISSPQGRAAYRLSAQGAQNIAAFAHTGKIGKPLVSIAGSADMFITPQNNAIPYLNAVRKAGAANTYWQYIVSGGTHVDTFAAFGYGLQPQLPFAWAAFNELESVVERGLTPPGAGTSQTVSSPGQIPS